MRSLVIFTLIISISLGLQAQSAEKKALKTRPFQLSFLYPLGTNGVQSARYSNVVSINLLAGFNGGVNGIEFGAFINSIRYDVNGLQFGGFSNIIGRNVNGAQFAGFMNLSGKQLNGLQAAGFANVTGKGVNGFQLGGFLNVSGASVKGGQVSGFANIAGGDMQGLQIAGFMNIAKKLSGLQLGFFNYADSAGGGIPVGFLSIVRKGGYAALDLGGNETLYGVASLKLGVPRFYNILSASIRPDPDADQFSWAVGYGIGSQIARVKGFALHLEGISYQLYEDGWRINDLNMLNRVQLNLHLHFSKQMSLYGGVAWNVAVSNRVDENGNIGSSLIPYSTYNRLIRNTRVQMYPGIQAGISL